VQIIIVHYEWSTHHSSRAFLLISDPGMSTNRVFPPSFHPTMMESDTRQSPLVSSSAVRYYLSLGCIGWYTVHWFIQLVGVYAASVTSSITITGRTTRLPRTFCPPTVDGDTVRPLQDLPAAQLLQNLSQEFQFYAL